MIYDGAMAKLAFLIRREWLSVILGAILIALAGGAIAGPLGPHDLAALRSHRTALETRRAELLADNAALKEKIQKLRSDNHYVEGLIRRELGYARPGELVYKFADTADNPPR
jgi:cell division protein FtsB